MIEHKVSKKLTVKLYESPDEMPMDLYFLSNQYGLLDFEAGSSLIDVNKKFSKLDAFLMSRNWEEAIQERNNLHQTFNNIIASTHFPSLQFGCHIHSVNGEKVDDYSTKNLMAIMKRMGKEGFTFRTLQDVINQVKKNFNRELTLLFPEKYTDTARMNYFTQIKTKIIAEQKFILTGEQRWLNELKNVFDYFMSLMRPKNINWNDSRNVVIEAKRSYERLCSILMQAGVQSPGQLSVIKFHIAVETYESKRRVKPK